VGKAEDLIEALLTSPPSTHPESQVGDRRWWSDEGYKVGSLTGRQQEAAIYLGHIKNACGLQGWVLTHTLVRAIKEDPELIEASARMKRMMLED